MKVAVFSSKPYERESLDAANERHHHELHHFEPRLELDTVPLAGGFRAVCVFVNDVLDGLTLRALHEAGTRHVALRCAGFNNVDLTVADELGIDVVRVPAYSPHAVAEHTVGLILTLNRKFHRAHARVREGNFSLNSLMGFDLHGRTIGIVGTGQIGTVMAQIMVGFGCELLGHDPYPSDACRDLGMRYVALDELFTASDIISLHCPLTPQTYHMIDTAAIERMKPGVMLINTGRGALIETTDVIQGLKSGRIGYLGLDVYEEESSLFFRDLSDQVIHDDVFARLTTFPNVLVTAHQGFFTREALANIAETTLANLDELERTGDCDNRVTSAAVRS